MVRTQIQLPDPLYHEVQRLAREQDWSIAEVLRRGAEAVLRLYPAHKETRKAGWKLPPPLNKKLLVTDHQRMKEIIREEAESYF